MMRISVLLIFSVFLSLPIISQVQLGQRITGPNPYDEAGSAVALSSSGDRLGVGIPFFDENGMNAGAIQIYDLISGKWVQTGNTILGEPPLALMGSVVSLASAGSRIGVGGYTNNGEGEFRGIVRIYELFANQWMQLGNDILAEAAEDEVGSFVELSTNGKRIAIGSYGEDSNGKNIGQVKIYEYNGMNWTQLGGDIEGEEDGDKTGIAVSMSADGNRIAIGAPYNSSFANYAGAVKTYEYDGYNWIQLGNEIYGEAAMDYAGNEVSLSGNGNRIAVGAYHNDGNGVNAGHVRVFEYLGGDWIQIGSDLDGLTAGEHFGRAIDLSMDGNVLAVGAPLNDENGENSGQVRLFEYVEGSWIQKGDEIKGSGKWSEFGSSVALSSDGDILAVGEPKFSESHEASGAVYVYGFAPTNLSAGPSLTDIRIFPNPCSAVVCIKIQGNSEPTPVTLINAQGSRLQRAVILSEYQFDLSGYPAGMYYLQVNGSSFNVFIASK